MQLLNTFIADPQLYLVFKVTEIESRSRSLHLWNIFVKQSVLSFDKIDVSSIMPTGFYLSEKVKSSRHENVHIYYVKHILSLRHFEGNISLRHQDIVAILLFQYEREREQRRFSNTEKFRVSGKVIWAKFTTLTFTKFLCFKKMVG